MLAERNGPTTSVASSEAGGSRRWWLLGAAAACVALLVGGLVLLAGDDQSLSPSTVPEPTLTTLPATVPSSTIEPSSTLATETSVPATTVVADLVVSDPSAISLDDPVRDHVVRSDQSPKAARCTPGTQDPRQHWPEIRFGWWLERIVTARSSREVLSMSARR